MNQAENITANWYAIYTRSKAEKKVLAEFVHSGIEAYLPLVLRLRQWSDRKKLVEEPLFRSYIFVHITEKEYFKVLNTQGVLKFISFGRVAVKIPPQQIEAIRYYVSDKESEEDNQDELSEGQLVRVKHGPMEGLIGRLIRMKGKFRLIVQIEAIGKSLTLNIPRTRVEPVSSGKEKLN
ncbi:MAG: UpxY family transcription antiterminator [Bacteroidales bacterium]|nr:UpxY family transcription antiterminator [Bacteroidales bacterium]